MGLFRKNPADVMPAQEELEKIRVKVLGAYAMCEVFDNEMLKGTDKSLRACAESDLLRYAMTIADADVEIESDELDALNKILGTDITAENAAQYLGKDGESFTDFMPDSFIILRDYYDTGLDMTIADCLYEIYEDLGAMMSRADGEIERDEKWEINSFLALLRRYAVTD